MHLRHAFALAIGVTLVPVGALLVVYAAPACGRELRTAASDACNGGPASGRALLGQLRAAAQAGDTPEQAMTRVGVAPIVDPHDPDYPLILLTVDMREDPCAPQDLGPLYSALRDLGQVLFWDTGVPAASVIRPGIPIVGLFWDRAGRPHFFRAQVLPP